MEYKQTKYVIAIHAEGDNLAVENSVDEAKLYIEKFNTRKAILISRTFNSKLERIVHNQVQVFKKGTMRQVDTNSNIAPEELLDGAWFGLKNGMMIIHDMPVTDVFVNKMLNHVEKGVDVTIHRNELTLMPSEINYIKNQMGKASQAAKNGETYVPSKRIIIRQHINSGFSVNPETVEKYTNGFGEIFGNEYGRQLGYMIFLGQYVIQRMRIEYRRICDVETLKYNQEKQYFIDPYHFSRDMATYCYIDVLNPAIIGADQQFIEYCQQIVLAHLKKFSEKKVEG